MTSNQIIDLMNQSPFHPFAIHLSDGTRVRIEEPFQIATRRNSPTCVVYEANEQTRFISIRNITEIVVESVGEASSE